VTDSRGTPEAGTALTRAGVAFVVLAAASGALLLFAPVVILGYTFTVLAAVIRGEGLAWGSVVGMSYAFGGIAALISLILLVIPYALLRAASRRLGTWRAVIGVGVTLVIWHAGVATILAWRGSGDERLIASAFWVAAFAILIATVVAARLGTRQAVILVGGLLVVWHAHVAAMLALVVTRAPGIGAEGLSIAFGVAAAAYLIATVVAARRAAGGGRSTAEA